jgi:hypothetical protein
MEAVPLTVGAIAAAVEVAFIAVNPLEILRAIAALVAAALAAVNPLEIFDAIAALVVAAFTAVSPLEIVGAVAALIVVAATVVSPEDNPGATAALTAATAAAVKPLLILGTTLCEVDAANGTAISTQLVAETDGATALLLEVAATAVTEVLTESDSSISISATPHEAVPPLGLAFANTRHARVEAEA